ncbi:MAG: hypothetical protein ACPG7F_00890 [Aggregatilineales bacterium]
MATLSATIVTDGSGDGTNLDSNSNPSWSGRTSARVLEGIRIEYGAADGTTDVTIEEVAGLKRTILSISNNNTDTTYTPTNEHQDTAGSSVSQYAPFTVDPGNLKVTVAQSGASKEITVFIEVW